MVNHYDVIKSPITTEKTTDMANNNVVVFKVDLKANKIQIRQAVEAIFKVKVDDVRTITVKPKQKRFGKHIGYRQKYKKAIVTLKDGSSINLD